MVGLAGIVLTLAAGQGLTAIVNLVRAKSVAVALGPVGTGTVSVVDQIAQLAVFTASFALPQASAKYLSRLHSQRHAAVVPVYQLFVQTLLVISICLAGVVSLVTLARPQGWGDELAPHAGLIVLAMATVPAAALHALQVYVFAALQLPKLASLTVLAGAALTGSAAVAGLLAAGLMGLYTGNLLATLLVAAVVLVAFALRFDLPLPRGWWPAWSQWRQHVDVLRFCATTYLVSVGYPGSFLLARYAILQHAGLAELGLFQSAYAIAIHMGLLVGQSTAYYLTPLMNRDTPAEERIRQALDFQRQMALSIPVIALPLALFPQLAITLLFSGAFVTAAPYLAVLLAGEIVLRLGHVLQALLIGLDDLRAYFSISLGAQALLAALAWFLAPTFGLWGVAVAFLAAPTVFFLACLTRLLVRYGARLRQRSVLAVLYGLLLLAVAGWLGQGLTTTTLAVATKLFFYAGAVGSLCFFLTREERHAVRLARLKLWPWPRRSQLRGGATHL